MKQVTTSVGFQDPLGNLVANGDLILDLSQPAEVTAGGGLIAPKRVVLPLTSVGKITPTNMYFNDELSPSGTTYHSQLLDSSLNLIADFGLWSIVGASADLSTMVPVGGGGGGSVAGAVLLNPVAQQNINGQTLNMEGASLSFSAAASTTADSFFSRLAAGIIGVGTAIGNALGTLRTAIVQIGGADTGLSRDSAGVIDVGNGTQGDFTGMLKVTTIGMGASGLITQGSIANLAGISSGGAAGTLALGNGTLGDTTGILKLTALNHGGTLSLPTSTDTLVGKATTDILTNKTVGAGGLAGLTFNKQVFTGNGTFTISTGITSTKVTLIGGGGAGGGATAANGGAGGGSGGVAIKFLTGLTPGNTIAVTVGGGGTGVSTAAGNGGAASTIASGTQTITTVTANGGAGGATGTVPQSGGNGAAVSTNGDYNGFGAAGAPYIVSPFGAMGGAGMFGGNGNVAGPNSPGNAAAANTGGGGGGAGAGANNAGGNGGSGVVIFEWVN